MTEPEKTTLKSSERRVSRFQKVAARRKAQERADARFYRIVFLLAAIGAAIAIGLGAFFINSTV